MAKIRLRVKRGDQKPFTRGNPRQCSIATAAKREFGGSAVVGGSTAKIRGRYYVLGTDAQNVVADHDGGSRVGSRTITLYGKPIRTVEEQAQEAREAAAGRKRARAARKAKAAERAAAASEQARAPQRPDPRQQARTAAREQPRAAERPRTAEDERAAGARARIQEAEARGRLRAAEQVRTAPPRTAQTRVRVPGEQAAPQPRAAGQARAASRQAGRVPQPREQLRAIEPPRPALRWLRRNPFATRPEPEAQPARTRRTA